MTDGYELSRRKTLAGLATIGAAGAGAGMGTSALFSDTETVGQVVQAGSLDLSVTAEVIDSVDNDHWNDLSLAASSIDGEATVALDVGDVKPGDWAIMKFDLVVEGNPGYVRVRSGELTSFENGRSDPEADVDDSGGDPGENNGELDEFLVAEPYSEYDDADGEQPRSSLSGRADVVQEGSAIRDTAQALEDGVVLQADDEPVEVGAGGTSWYLLLLLPLDVGNVIQTDSIEFDLHFDSEQVRNNDSPFNSTD